MVLARVAGMVSCVPFFSSTAIPMKSRVFLAAAIAILVLPFVPISGTIPSTFGDLVLAIFSELLLGLAFGLMLTTIFAALQLGGLMIGQQMGLALARVFDPLFNDQSSVLGQLYFWLAMMIFLIIRGHIILIRSIANSFNTIAPGQFVVTEHFVSDLLSILQLSFIMAFQIAAPIIVAIFLATLAMGFITRTVPQLNILSIGFSIRVLLGFVLIVVCLAPALGVFLSGLEKVFAGLYQITGS